MKPKDLKISVDLKWQEIEDILSGLCVFIWEMENESRPKMKSPITLRAVKRLYDKFWRINSKLAKIRNGLASR